MGLEPPAGAFPLSDALLYGAPLAGAVRPTEVAGLHIAPSDGPMMETTEARLHERLDGLSALGAALYGMAYDYAVLDCRPGLGPLTLGAMSAAGRVIAPVEPSRYSLEGLANLQQVGTNAVARPVIYALINKHNPRRAVAAWLEQMLARARTPRLQTRIRHSEAINQAAVMQRPVVLYSPRSAAAADFHALAAEVEALW